MQFLSQYAVIKDMMICFMAYVSNKSQIIHLKCENIPSSHLAVQPEIFIFHIILYSEVQVW